MNYKNIDKMCSSNGINITEFIEKNKRLIMKQAFYFHKKFGISCEDLFQEGCIGVCIAGTKYDSNRGTKFTTFAYDWINQAMREYCFNTVSAIRVPKSVQIADTKQTKEILEKGALAHESTISRCKNVMSINDDENPIDHGYEVDFDNSEISKTMTVTPEIKAKIKALLTDKEYFILSMRYGLEDGVAYSMGKLSEIMDCSREWVNVLEKRILNTLRDNMQLADVSHYEV